jgi:RNA polymerase sigma-70 factor (ECF subfamily)
MNDAYNLARWLMKTKKMVDFREVVVLRELEGLSYKEISEVSGVPLGTVMSRLARARHQLYLLLSDRKQHDLL